MRSRFVLASTADVLVKAQWTTVLVGKTIRESGATLPTPPEADHHVESLLELCEKCWHANPEKRPTMSAVLTELVKLVQEDEDVIAWSSRSFTTKS